MRRDKLIEYAYYAGQHAMATAMERGGEFLAELRRAAGETTAANQGIYIAEISAQMRLQVEAEMHRRDLPILERAQALMKLRRAARPPKRQTEGSRRAQ